MHSEYRNVTTVPPCQAMFWVLGRKNGTEQKMLLLLLG